MLSAEPVGRVMLFKVAHTSDPSLDPAVILLKSIIQIDVRPVADDQRRCVQGGHDQKAGCEDEQHAESARTGRPRQRTVNGRRAMLRLAGDRSRRTHA